MSTFLATTIQVPNPGDTVIIGGLPVNSVSINYSGGSSTLYTVPTGRIAIVNLQTANLNSAGINNELDVGNSNFDLQSFSVAASAYIPTPPNTSPVGGPVFLYLSAGQQIINSGDNTIQAEVVEFNVP